MRRFLPLVSACSRDLHGQHSGSAGPRQWRGWTQANLLAYAKNDQADLPPTEKRAVSDLAAALKATR